MGRICVFLHLSRIPVSDKTAMGLDMFTQLYNTTYKNIYITVAFLGVMMYVIFIIYLSRLFLFP